MKKYIIVPLIGLSLIQLALADNPLPTDKIINHTNYTISSMNVTGKLYFHDGIFPGSIWPIHAHSAIFADRSSTIAPGTTVRFLPNLAFLGQNSGIKIIDPTFIKVLSFTLGPLSVSSSNVNIDSSCQEIIHQIMPFRSVTININAKTENQDTTLFCSVEH